MTQTITPFLMFQGQAQEAIDLYLSVFSDARIIETERFGEAGAETMRAKLELAGLSLLILDSPPVHDFSFTPSVSLFVTFDDEAELDAAFEALSKDGAVMMPLNAYPFSRKYAWLSDRFGVSWQLSLEG